MHMNADTAINIASVTCRLRGILWAFSRTAAGRPGMEEVSLMTLRRVSSACKHLKDRRG